MKSITENSNAFVIRFWLEPREIKGAKPVWRGQIEHLESGKRLYVKNLSEVEAFLASHLPGIPTGEESLRS